MPLTVQHTQFLASVHPYDSLTEDALAALAADCDTRAMPAGETVFDLSDTVQSLYIIEGGEVEITDDAGVQLSLLGPRNSFGERALLRDGTAAAVLGELGHVEPIRLDERRNARTARRPARALWSDTRPLTFRNVSGTQRRRASWNQVIPSLATGIIRCTCTVGLALGEPVRTLSSTPPDSTSVSVQTL